MTLRRISTLALALVLTGGCAAAPTVTVESYRPIAGEKCSAVINSVPGELLTQGQREITAGPVSNYVAAWGDPIIVLQCGVTTPADATLMPEVITVNGIDWRYEELDGGTRFYSDSLQTVFRLDVPSTYDNPTDALADLSDALQIAKN